MTLTTSLSLHLSDVVYSYPDTCVVPFYKGYEKHSKFNPQDARLSPTEMPFSEAYKRGYDYFNGCQYIGLATKELKVGFSCTDTPWNCGQYGTFHPVERERRGRGMMELSPQRNKPTSLKNGTYSFPHSLRSTIGVEVVRAGFCTALYREG